MHYIHTWPRPVHSGLVILNSHTENWDQEITGMNVNVHAISRVVNIPTCTSIEDIQVGTKQDKDLKG